MIKKIEKPTILENEIKAIIKYGRIKIKTRLGVLEYSYKIEKDDYPEYQIEVSVDRYDKLSDEEIDEIDDLIIKAINN